MTEQLEALTRDGVILNDATMLTHVKHLYEVAMDHRQEWTPRQEGSAPHFFKTPEFSYPRPRAIRRARAQLIIHPEDSFGPAEINITDPKLKARQASRQPFVIFPRYLYSMILPSVRQRDAFNIQRGSYSETAARDYLINPDPKQFVLETDTERLVVQSIIGAALKEFSPAEVPVAG